MLATDTLAQTGLTIHLNGLHGQIYQKVGLKSRSRNTDTHIIPNLVLCTSCPPDTYLVQTTYPPLVGVGSPTKRQVAKGNQPRV